MSGNEPVMNSIPVPCNITNVFCAASHEPGFLRLTEVNKRMIFLDKKRVREYNSTKGGICRMIDNIDKKILKILQKNARISNADIARSIGMAPSAILERIRKLEAKKVIEGYELRINPLSLGLGLTTFILLRTEESVGSHETGKKLASIPEVQEIHHIAGDYCYILKARVADTEALGALLKKFGSFPEVSDTRTTLVLKSIKDSLQLPLAPEGDDDSSDLKRE